MWFSAIMVGVQDVRRSTSSQLFKVTIQDGRALFAFEENF